MVNFLIGYLTVSLMCLPFVIYLVYKAPMVEDDDMYM